MGMPHATLISKCDPAWLSVPLSGWQESQPGGMGVRELHSLSCGMVSHPGWYRPPELRKPGIRPWWWPVWALPSYSHRALSAKEGTWAKGPSAAVLYRLPRCWERLPSPPSPIPHCATAQVSARTLPQGKSQHFHKSLRNPVA